MANYDKVGKVEKFVQKTQGNKSIYNYVKNSDWKIDPVFVHLVLDLDILTDVSSNNQDYLNKLRQIQNSNQDSRSPKQFSKDLILGWLIEDALLELLQQNNFQAQLNGGDSDRVIETNLSNVSTDADLKVNGNAVEVVTDYGGWWQSHDEMHIREWKVDNMNNNDYLIGIDLDSQSIFFSKFKDIDIVQHIESYKPYGGQPVYELDASTVDFYDVRNVKQALHNLK
jgi:hypothetical protein